MTEDNNSSEQIAQNAAALAALGLDDVAYVKPVMSEDLRGKIADSELLAPGIQLFALHAANGTPILVADSLEAALAGAWEKSLSPVPVH